MPLSAFSVLELGGDVATRYCARLFAQMGARVVCVRSGDDRTLGYAAEAGMAYGRWLDESKVPIESPDQVDGTFDLVIAGLDEDTIRKAAVLCDRMAKRPMLLTITWFDSEGPYGDWCATDEIINALNGIAYNFGIADGPPMLPQGHGPQITAGLVAFNASVAALSAERRPATIAVNVFEAAMCFVETGAIAAKANALPLTPRLGVNRFSPTYPASSYPSADGWVGITCLTPAQWAAMCGLIGRPELATDPRYATAYDRLLHGDEVDALLRPAAVARTTQEWVELGDVHRIPITAMPEPAALAKMEHWRERGAFAAVDGIAAPTLPYRFQFSGRPEPHWTGDASQGPLAGVRVIDFSMGWAGPLCARTLADLGADVIKIESEGHPDWWRGWESGSVDVRTREVNHNFIAVNRNKRGIDLDLTTPQGVSAARALIATADVVVENFAAGVLTRLGLGPAAQRQVNPRIISLSMPAFGNGGPRSGQRAYGSTVEQSSGLPFVNGEADWPPCLQHIAFGDPIAGLYAASAVLAALAGRERLGGAEIDLAQVACLFQMGADAIIAAQLNGGTLARTGHRRARLALCTVVQARDGCLTVAARAEDIAALAGLVGGDTRAALAAWARERDAHDAACALQAVRVAAAPVLPAHGLCDNAHLNASGFWCELERDFVGRHPAAAPPFRFDGAYPVLRRPAPTLGEHTAEVLAEFKLDREVDEVS